jgi:hypothetical protein
MNYWNKKLCIFSGPVYTLFFAIGLMIAGFIPPPSPDLDAYEIKRLFVENTASIQVGTLLIMAIQGLFVLFVSEISEQLRRIEGQQASLANAQLVLGFGTTMIVIFPCAALLVASFRADALAPEIVQLLNDLMWLPFIGGWFMLVPQWLVTGIVILQDDRAIPIFPRWSAFVQFWVALLTLPSTALFFLKNGPFALDGFFAFWLAGGVFFSWILIMTFLLLNAVSRQRVEASQNIQCTGAGTEYRNPANTF